MSFPGLKTKAYQVYRGPGARRGDYPVVLGDDLATERSRDCDADKTDRGIRVQLRQVRHVLAGRCRRSPSILRSGSSGLNYFRLKIFFRKTLHSVLS